MSPQQQNQQYGNKDKKEQPEVMASSRTPNQNQNSADRKHASPRPVDDEDDMRSKASQKDRDEDDSKHSGGWKSPGR